MHDTTKLIDETVRGLRNCQCGDTHFHLATLVAEVGEAEWDRGYKAGFSNAMRRMSDEPLAPKSPNPYRAPRDYEGDD